MTRRCGDRARLVPVTPGPLPTSPPAPLPMGEGENPQNPHPGPFASPHPPPLSPKERGETRGLARVSYVEAAERVGARMRGSEGLTAPQSFFKHPWRDGRRQGRRREPASCGRDAPSCEGRKGQSPFSSGGSALNRDTPSSCIVIHPPVLRRVFSTHADPFDEHTSKPFPHSHAPVAAVHAVPLSAAVRGGVCRTTACSSSSTARARPPCGVLLVPAGERPRAEPRDRVQPSDRSLGRPVERVRARS